MSFLAENVFEELHSKGYFLSDALDALVDDA